MIVACSIGFNCFLFQPSKIALGSLASLAVGTPGHLGGFPLSWIGCGLQSLTGCIGKLSSFPFRCLLCFQVPSIWIHPSAEAASTVMSWFSLTYAIVPSCLILIQRPAAQQMQLGLYLIHPLQNKHTQRMILSINWLPKDLDYQESVCCYLERITCIWGFGWFGRLR